MKLKLLIFFDPEISACFKTQMKNDEGNKNVTWNVEYRSNNPQIIQLRWPSGTCVRPGSCKLGFDSKSDQTNDFKIGIHSFPA